MEAKAQLYSDNSIIRKKSGSDTIKGERDTTLEAKSTVKNWLKYWRFPWDEKLYRITVISCP